VRVMPVDWPAISLSSKSESERLAEEASELAIV
jgi:hypothetical protein